ncbi:uncharacterized protein HMPREF1541_05437 [Cyphellophora europaea CBS 101466]|uniref:Peroxisomal membrane protein PEX17 n=1 Tax=Cyphellophora europaea (strain CBS 101466) TaxID=1220924 RepID=W2RU14_CYPE1|nr:uncharacterized protein HMPREF1541_05437 [Cyphellophora europaea CBS 101466]ETN39214.1 hypothetical protein HMPREF1541_05437 [Cyphellophora europaea CBS 101466]
MDRSLATLLRSLQASPTFHDAFRLLPTATALLTRLSNPLNLTLLSSQLLQNDILYPHPTSITNSRQLFSVFYTATLRFREDKRRRDPTQGQQQIPPPEYSGSQLSEPDWFTAVVKGADEHSPRSRHVLLLGALLLAGCDPHGSEEPVGRALRVKLEGALVRAANLALVHGDDEGKAVVSWVLVNTVHLLGEPTRAEVAFDALLPVLMYATFTGLEGLEMGYWVGAIDQDVEGSPDGKFGWSANSRSFQRVQEIKSRPMVQVLGGVSRLLAMAIDAAQDRQSIMDVVSRLAEFARTLATSWRQNKLSEVDISEEVQVLDGETIRVSLPVLLQLLRDTMFATIIALRSVVGRLLTDRFLASDINAPGIAIQCLHTLRDMYFISHRFGQTSSSQYVFVNFTALDLLNQYPRAAENYLATTKPKDAGAISRHPLDRNLDLFFLNTSEHLTLTVSARMNDELLQVALPYIQAQGDPRLGELYEAAHSLILTVFAAPQNADLLPKHVPHYIETLMASFPSVLNPRQFRLAIKAVVKLASPPSAIANLMPHLQAIVLDLLSQRLIHASEAILPSMSDIPMESQQPLSEKTTLLLAILDSLPFLPVSLLVDWLSISADLLFKLDSTAQRAICQQKFWETLSNGDMDVERAATCVTWWNHRGGRELAMLGELPEEEEYTMSGALGQESKL